MAEHARLSPSAAERWLSCPASVQVAERLPASTSPYAEEGTTAHKVAEHEVAAALGMPVVTLPEGMNEDMVAHAKAYAGFIVERAEQHPHTMVLLEQRVPTGVTGCWGTGDAILVSPEHIEVVDYKYGAGIPVTAHGNPQLRLYGVGALDQYGDVLGETQTVTTTVFQPRIGAGHVDSETLTAKELRQWREAVVAPAAKEALGPDPHFGPSEAACRFCPASGECKARLKHITRLDFGDPDLLSAEEMAEALAMIPQIRDWANALDKAGLERVYTRGETVPGWKVVRSGGKRTIPDVAAAVAKFYEAGIPPAEVTRPTLKTLADLTKIAGDLDDVLGDLIVKTEGRPSLVPESDKRPAIDPTASAAGDFS